MESNALLFEIIRISIGISSQLSVIPTERDWEVLFYSSKKHALLGITFVGLQSLLLEGKYTIHLSRNLYLKWLSVVMQIQDRNRDLDEICVELQNKISNDGYVSLVLKGQGVARFYKQKEQACFKTNITPNYFSFRQPGDIDIFILSDKNLIINYSLNINSDCVIDSHHARFNYKDKAIVEMHFVPINHPNFFYNKKLQFWISANLKCSTIDLDSRKLFIPNIEFNLVFSLIHIFHHFMNEGVGLRQIMDYYYLITEYCNSNTPNASSVKNIIQTIGLTKFASAIMWILNYVFFMNEKYLIWIPSEQDGKIVLSEIMNTGNFGKMYSNSILKKSIFERIKYRLLLNIRMNRFDRTYFLWSILDGVKVRINLLFEHYK